METPTAIQGPTFLLLLVPVGETVIFLLPYSRGFEKKGNLWLDSFVIPSLVQ
jgi:hypothetical protein